MHSSPFVWLAPIVLFFLIVLRIIRRDGKDSSNQARTQNKYVEWGGGIFVVAIIFTFALFNWSAIFKPRENCPTTLSPDMLDKMSIQGNDFAAGLLTNKKFVLDLKETSKTLGKDLYYNDFTYSLFTNPRKGYLETKLLRERVTIDSLNSGSLLYYIADMDVCEQFMDYLNRLGVDSLIDERYDRDKHFFNSRIALKYRHSIFVYWGYRPKQNEQAYLIEIFSADSLKRKDN